MFLQVKRRQPVECSCNKRDRIALWASLRSEEPASAPHFTASSKVSSEHRRHSHGSNSRSTAPRQVYDGRVSAKEINQLAGASLRSEEPFKPASAPHLTASSKVSSNSRSTAPRQVYDERVGEKEFNQLAVEREFDPCECRCLTMAEIPLTQN
jgi:hypothetical protein